MLQNFSIKDDKFLGTGGIPAPNHSPEIMPGEGIRTPGGQGGEDIIEPGRNPGGAPLGPEDQPGQSDIPPANVR